MKFKKIIAITLAVMTIMSVMAISASAASIADRAHDNCFTNGNSLSAESTGNIGGIFKSGEIKDSVQQTVYYDEYVESASIAVTNNVQWTLKDGVLTFYGEGPVASGMHLMFNGNTHIETIVIEEGITYMPDWCQFINLPNLKTIVIMDAGLNYLQLTQNCPNLEHILVGVNLKNSMFTGGSTKEFDKTIMLSKNVASYATAQGVQGITVRDDCNVYTQKTAENIYITDGVITMPSEIRAKNFFRDNAVVPYSQLINEAKAVINTLPASVVAKMPAELTDGTTQTNNKPNFSDIKPGAYYADAVAWAVKHGITNGTSDSTFSPDNTCTTAQILTMLYRAYGSPAVNISNPFTNVNSDAYYYNAILWAYSKGILNGGNFNANEPCTRASTVMFMWQAAGCPNATTQNSFKDMTNHSTYQNAVNWALEHGVTKGTSDTTFAPTTTCTRGQIATFLWRAMGN